MLAKHQLRAIIFYEWLQKNNATVAANNINKALGEGTVSRWIVNHWYHRFENDEIDFEDKERSGRPRCLDDEQLCEAISENPVATTRDLAEKFGVSHSIIAHRLRQLGYRKVHTRWINTHRHKIK